LLRRGEAEGNMCDRGPQRLVWARWVSFGVVFCLYLAMQVWAIQREMHPGYLLIGRQSCAVVTGDVSGASALVRSHGSMCRSEYARVSLNRDGEPTQIVVVSSTGGRLCYTDVCANRRPMCAPQRVTLETCIEGQENQYWRFNVTTRRISSACERVARHSCLTAAPRAAPPRVVMTASGSMSGYATSGAGGTTAFGESSTDEVLWVGECNRKDAHQEFWWTAKVPQEETFLKV